ncbi:SDR family NAD(P)-dependent oxidoreductase [Nisaea nitritireducens]|uniref:SDR family NAD(P)-dependent oxidoreductase n=1 Tax=Nisaea nitritireducens TaxID=568392 RepID=UPI001866C69F|nr:SDR family NAD(P)-dependent oxidoreductase [Nisaea nitritireducens]
MSKFESFTPGGVAVVIGASGGIGSALFSALNETGRFKTVLGFSRRSPLPIDLADEASLERAAKAAAADGEIRLVIDATGFLHQGGEGPEKTWRELDAQKLATAFAINAIGPALLMKHFLPRLPRTGKTVFATLSARVGSIGDNRLGGWYGYRASKAALNQFVRTASVELARRAPEAVCVALHPGTVDTHLSVPFAKQGLDLHSPDAAAANLLSVLDRLNKEDTGGFFDWQGARVPW